MLTFNEMDWRIGEDKTEDAIIIKRFQDIPTEFIDQNRFMKQQSREHRAGESHSVARIPEVVVNAWLAQGFNVYKESNKACLARLRAEGLDDFITSVKRV